MENHYKHPSVVFVHEVHHISLSQHLTLRPALRSMMALHLAIIRVHRVHSMESLSVSSSGMAVGDVEGQVGFPSLSLDQ